MPLGVQRTADLRRVAALPRRTWTATEIREAVEILTTALRTPRGQMRLFPIQAIALAECGAYGGLFAPIAVGQGKTLISLLVFTVLQAKRPLLLVPANLAAKTKASQRVLSEHWQIHDHIRIESYELMGRPQAAEMLERYNPDVIACDESHRLKNARGAAVARRVFRHLAQHPECLFVAETGTVSKRSLKDFGHIVRRALGPGAPVPNASQLEEWAEALDERPYAENIRAPGALLDLCGLEESDLPPLEAARRAFRRRLVETPGVVATSEAALGCSLSITTITPKLNRETLAALDVLRTQWELPDHHPFMDGMRVWAAARQLALGFFYKWDPAPPKAWLEARREWYSQGRHILSTNRRNLDSPQQVTQAVAAGFYPAAEPAYAAWCAIRDSFKPNTVAVWLDDGPIEAAAKWAKQGPGIIWTEHRAFAARLAERTGLPYYGRQGRDALGREIPEWGLDLTCGRGVIIASLANRTGRNLQGWNRNLVTSPPPNGEWWEQLLGRTHRTGQPADAVTYDVFITCPEHRDALDQASRDAEYIGATIGPIQKLSYADRVGVDR